MIAEVMEARIVSAMLFNEDGSELVIRGAHGLDPETVARTRVKSGASIAGWVAQTSESLLVNDIESDRRFRKLNHSQYETKSLLCVPFQLGGETVGVVNVSSKANGSEFDSDDLNLLTAITKRVAMALERARESGEAGDVSATLRSVRAIIRAKRNHALRGTRPASRLATDLGRRLGLAEDEVEVLGYIARVHDVGMLAVGEDVLDSTGSLGPAEHRRIEEHPRESVRLLQPIEFVSRVNEIILCHHEHYDGRGYPRGMSREQIPLASRILSVVDAYEAMTLGRPYRDAMSGAEALAELCRCAGTQFDPRVVAAVERLLADTPLPIAAPAAAAADDRATAADRAGATGSRETV
jgi:hypothetical protein